MKFLSGVVFFLVQATLVAQAQRSCGTSDYIQRLIKADPAVNNSFLKAAALVNAVVLEPANARDLVAVDIITVPVVIHVVYNTADENISTEQIQSQLIVLNNDYSNLNADKFNTPPVFEAVAADTKIRFCLAQVDPHGRRTTGIIRTHTNSESFTPDDAVKYTAQGGDDAWDCTKYLNIWVCSMGGRTLGYSSIPGGPAATDGVVISYDVFGTIGNLHVSFNRGRTATHETGHWLGLKHVWGDAICGSDDVDDTPSQQYYNYGCPTFPHATSCSPDANGDMYMNYMDFTNDACMSLFTNGQKLRMRALFATGNVRNSFLTGSACDSAQASAAPLPATDTVAAMPPEADIKVYPNPMQSSVVVEYKGTAKSISPATINVFSVTGSKILTVVSTSAKTSVNVSGLAKGVYIFSIEEGNKRYTKKVIKE